MLNDVLNNSLNLIFRHKIMDTFSEGDQHLTDIFLLGFQIFDERAIKG